MKGTLLYVHSQLHLFLAATAHPGTHLLDSDDDEQDRPSNRHEISTHYPQSSEQKDDTDENDQPWNHFMTRTLRWTIHSFLHRARGS